MSTSDHCTKLHKQLGKIIKEKDRTGWQTKEVEDATKLLHAFLWILANNDSIPDVILEKLVDT